MIEKYERNEPTRMGLILWLLTAAPYFNNSQIVSTEALPALFQIITEKVLLLQKQYLHSNPHPFNSNATDKLQAHYNIHILAIGCCFINRLEYFAIGMDS